MFSFSTVCLQLISDAGYQGEITSVSTACHQIEVFSRVMKTSSCSFVEEGDESLEANLPEFAVSKVMEKSFLSSCRRFKVYSIMAKPQM